MGTPNKIIAIITKIQTIISIMTIKQAIKVHNSIIDSLYYRFNYARGNNPKTHLQITQEGDEG